MQCSRIALWVNVYLRDICACVKVHRAGFSSTGRLVIRGWMQYNSSKSVVSCRIWNGLVHYNRLPHYRVGWWERDDRALTDGLPFLYAAAITCIHRPTFLTLPTPLHIIWNSNFQNIDFKVKLVFVWCKHTSNYICTPCKLILAGPKNNTCLDEVYLFI